MQPNTPAPVWIQLFFITVAPPIMAVLIHFLSRGWAMTVQGGKISERTRKRQRLEFWGVLIFMYLMGFGMIIYAHFFKH